MVDPRNTSRDPMVTPEERREADLYLHRIQLYRQLNLSEIERLIATHMLMTECLISISSFSYLTGYSRRAVRTTIRDFSIMGLVIQYPEGWVMSDFGRWLFITINREAREIATGSQRTWSQELLKVFRSLPSEGRERPFGPKHENWGRD